jgi:protein ImuB
MAEPGSERVACAWVPDLPLAAILRAEPALRDAALVVVDGEGPRAVLLAATPAARALGAVPGQRLQQARGLAPGLQARPRSAALIRSAQAALGDVVRSFSPRVALPVGGAPDGLALVGLGGLERLFGDERRLARSLEAALVRAGLPARVGVAAGPLLARLAARCGAGVVSPGAERGFLAPLPIGLLEPSAELVARLQRFGIERLGELARLPSQGLGLRLGPEGLGLWRLARGELAPERLVTGPAPERFVEEAEPGFELDGLGPLLSLLDGACQRLAGRLLARGLAARALLLELALEPAGRAAWELELAAPTRRPATWLELARLALERAPPRAPVRSLRLVAEPAVPRRAQLDLFVRAGPEGGRLDEALARLAALVGPGRVGVARLPDGHRPEAGPVAPFGCPSGPEAVLAPDAVAASLPLRAVRPPEPVEVRAEPAPVGFRLRTLQGARVRAQAGPYRLSAGWWEEAPLGRDDYEVELADGRVVRLYREHGSGAWFVDARVG